MVYIQLYVHVRLNCTSFTVSPPATLHQKEPCLNDVRVRRATRPAWAKSDRARPKTPWCEGAQQGWREWKFTEREREIYIYS